MMLMSLLGLTMGLSMGLDIPESHLFGYMEMTGTFKGCEHNHEGGNCHEWGWVGPDFEITTQMLHDTIGNDRMSWMQISPFYGCQATLWEHSGCNGGSWKFGWGVQPDNYHWNDVVSCIKIKCDTDAKWNQWSNWSDCDYNGCGTGTQTRSRTCEEGAYHGKKCSDLWGSYTEKKSCQVVACPTPKPTILEVVDVKCLDWKTPEVGEIQDMCTTGLIDILFMTDQTTHMEPVHVELETGEEAELSRTNSQAMTTEDGWNWGETNSEYESITDSTEITTKSPSVSMGFSGASASHSCFNEKSTACTTSSAMGIGSGGLSGVFGGLGRRRRLLLGGLNFVKNIFGGGSGDADECKCKSTTVTKTEESGSTHETTFGQMRTQSETLENSFTESTTEYSSVSLEFDCPPFSRCTFAQYTMTSFCAIPYWGDCTVKFNSGEEIQKTVGKPYDGGCECVGVQNSSGKGSACNPDHLDNGKQWCYVEKGACSDGMSSSKVPDHEWSYEACHSDTLFWSQQSSDIQFTYGPVVIGLSTTGDICGVKLIPVVPNAEGVYSEDYITCPTMEELQELPNCDCMLEMYQDCGTEDGVLTAGSLCRVNNRPMASEDELCLESQPTWKDLSNCWGAEVFLVSDYNTDVWSDLAEKIAQPDTKDYGFVAPTGCSCVEAQRSDMLYAWPAQCLTNPSDGTPICYVEQDSPSCLDAQSSTLAEGFDWVPCVPSGDAFEVTERSYCSESGTEHEDVVWLDTLGDCETAGMKYCTFHCGMKKFAASDECNLKSSTCGSYVVTFEDEPDCECVGVENSEGRGAACNSQHLNSGKQWCYVEKGACSDGISSSKVPDYEWSYEACPYTCECVGFENSEGNGASCDPDVTDNGKQWCYVNKNSCSDGMSSWKAPEYEWSFEVCPQAATEPEPEPVVPACECVGVVNEDLKGASCSAETTYDGKQWCYVEIGACADGKSSSKVADYEWSYQVCPEPESDPVVIPSVPDDAEFSSFAEYKLALLDLVDNADDKEATCIQLGAKWSGKKSKCIVPGSLKKVKCAKVKDKTFCKRMGCKSKKKKCAGKPSFL